MKSNSVSKLTQRNWLIDVVLGISALIASLTGIYFLYIPVNGYQGGRNPMSQVQILFTRHTWDNLHTWGGVIMIAVAVIHLILHWNWLVKMVKRSMKEFAGKCDCLNPRGRWNLLLDIIVAISFLLSAVSGVYFLFVTGGRSSIDPLFLFSRYTWDMIHTWSAVILIISGVLHLTIHWIWVTKVAGNLFQSLFPKSMGPNMAGSIEGRQTTQI
jgi:hypothetical protein